MAIAEQIARWLSVDEAAEAFGLSPSTVRRLVAAGAVRAIQPGGPKTAIRIDRLDLESRCLRPAREEDE